MDNQIIANAGGIQFVSQDQTAKQIVYLDFNGESTTYRNSDLNLAVDVQVKNSGISFEHQAYIVSKLIDLYADSNICFTIEKPVNNEQYSTIYIGNIDDFDEFG